MADICVYICILRVSRLSITSYAQILPNLTDSTTLCTSMFRRILPTVGEITVLAVQIHKNIWVDWRRTRTIFQAVWEGIEYLWSWIAYFGECLCGGQTMSLSALSPSAMMAGCMGCITWVQTEGITGIFSYCWNCLSAAATTSPTATFESCWNSVSGCFTGAGEWCSSLAGALTRGPAGVLEFCTAGINSCGEEGSLLSRMGGCATYTWTSITGAVSYVSAACSSCSAQYGPVVYRWMIALRDWLWSWLMWLWRQVQLFFR